MQTIAIESDNHESFERVRWMLEHFAIDGIKIIEEDDFKDLQIIREARKERPPRGFAGRCLPIDSAIRESGRRVGLWTPVSRRLLPIPTFSLSRKFQLPKCNTKKRKNKGSTGG